MRQPFDLYGAAGELIGCIVAASIAEAVAIVAGAGVRDWSRIVLRGAEHERARGGAFYPAHS
jgi:hypothetical protein